MKTAIFIIISVIIIVLVLRIILKPNKKSNLEENTVTDDYIPFNEPEKFNQKEEGKHVEEIPHQEKKDPEIIVNNDKIIIVEGANYLNIKKAVQQFCDTYKKENPFNSVIRISKFDEDKSVLTFPDDVDFFTFSALVNYLYYPKDIFYSADIKGWTTLKSGNGFTEPEIINKYAMLFIPFDDNEYDNVYFVTEDNKTYKWSFSDTNPAKLKTSIQHFVENKFGIEESVYKPVEEIK